MKLMGNLLIGLALLIGGYVAYEQIHAFYLEKKLIANTEELSESLRTEIVNRNDGIVEEGMKETVPLKNLHISIPKINLKTKVLEGSSTDILKVAVGHLEGTGRLGVEGENFVALGHRSHVTGKFFNRLDELSVGDQIDFIADNQGFHYKVIDKKIIEPTQLEVLEPVKNKSIVTLITCHPMYSNKQRLVVVGEKVPN
ncbi:class D sortase [Pseudalkalibacillus sp. SCS-8]|uniref:class D sortase n=1 Tax=Pseudalkalibacillus nanhaiensis TaxID=3115291 RepID=UPI0032DBA3B2